MVEKPRSKLGWAFYVKLVLTFGVLGFLATLVKWPDLIREIQHSDPRWLAIGTLLSGCSVLIVTLRWWLLMKVQEIRLTFRHTLALTFIGQFFSAFLMGANGGDVMRVFYAMRAVPNQKAKSTMTILVDRLFGTLMVLAWIFAVLPYEVSRISGDPAMAHKLVLFKVILLVMAIGAVVLFFAPFHLFPPWSKRLWGKIPKREMIAELHADSRLYLRRWPLTLSALLCAATIHLINFTAFYFLAKGFGLQMTFSAAVLILSFTMMAAAAPLSIGGHGIREVTFISLFTLFQIEPFSKEICIALSLTFYLLYQFSWSAVGGMVYLFYHHQVKKVEGEAEVPPRHTTA